MSGGNHTPGPWTAEYDDYGDEVWFGGEGCGMWTVNEPGCYLAGFGEDTEDKKAIAKADAVLIAAAPELLNALEFLTEWAETFKTAKDRPPLVYVENARAALKNARGAA